MHLALTTYYQQLLSTFWKGLQVMKHDQSNVDRYVGIFHIYIFYSYTFGLYFVSFSALTRELKMSNTMWKRMTGEIINIYLQLHIWLIFFFVDRVDKEWKMISEILIRMAEISYHIYIFQLRTWLIFCYLLNVSIVDLFWIS